MIRSALQALCIFSCCWIGANAFLNPQQNDFTPRIAAAVSSSTLLRAAPAKKVHVLPTEDEVTSAVHTIVQQAAKHAIATRGHFALAIPGGSVLKVLSSLEPHSDWVKKTTLAFVNHKCVPIDDTSSAIEAQAREKFLNRWGLTDIISLGGTSDGEKEAKEYEAKMKAIPETKLPRDADGFPVFDLALVGVGDDGQLVLYIQTEVKLM